MRRNDQSGTTIQHLGEALAGYNDDDDRSASQPILRPNRRYTARDLRRHGGTGAATPHGMAVEVRPVQDEEHDEGVDFRITSDPEQPVRH